MQILKGKTSAGPSVVTWRCKKISTVRPLAYAANFCCKKPKEAKDMIFMRLHADRDHSKGRIQSVDPVIDSRVSVPFVKMCGITSVHDAVLAAEAGAKFIGMILWPKSKRSVSLHVAKEISKAVRDHGAEPVGVFVDEDANEIERAYDATNIAFAQLHGNGARRALSSLVQHRNIIYVLHVDKSGVLLTKNPKEECSALVDWILIDSLSGGSSFFVSVVKSLIGRMYKFQLILVKMDGC
ncbi:N-(5'-phosphoribosyl)anthranilate isomerase 1, chloroplastic isoform X2 [Cryptomeria japonica]|uniref:N-(5'-phosphoribosyl)anthranilate isomerase 1, chloroplastic isoform X2 n=1 Tax=Cryptomeria japonica TaxID=3369 RepID=UPI0025ACC424|nr:N-(5'-phosphoribosyl)anthranilate isomerase 1, chloroplastic isoform X2 [Cryptomeria japonica]